MFIGGRNYAIKIYRHIIRVRYLQAEHLKKKIVGIKLLSGLLKVLVLLKA